jgi:tetratricopeptide (TPR) repeat protein
LSNEIKQMTSISKTSQDLLKEKVEKIVNTSSFVLLMKVFKNIISNPTEKKFQTVKKSEKISKLLTDEVIFILEKGGFENKNETLNYSEDKLIQLHETLIDVCRFAQPHQELNGKEVIMEWNSLMDTADELSKQKLNERALLFYKQGLQLVQGEYNKGYDLFLLSCCATYTSIGKFFESNQELAKAIEYHEKAIQLVPEDYINSMFDQDTLAIPCNAYFSMSISLLLLPSPEIHFDKIEKFLKISLSISERTDKKQVEKIANTLKMIALKKKNFNDFSHWDKKSKEFQTSSQSSHDTYVSRLMSIEQNIKGNPTKFIKKLIELAEETEITFPEFSGSLYGQVIFHYRTQKELDIKEGIHYGMKALEIMKKIHGEKDGIVRNVYLSLSDVYQRLGDHQKAKEYKMKQIESEVLMGLRKDENDF